MEVITATHQLELDPPFFTSNAACKIDNALCTPRCLVDGLPPNRKLPLRSEFVVAGGGGVGGELTLDPLGEDARSRDGVSERPSSEPGVIGLETIGMGIKLAIGVGVGAWTWASALVPREALEVSFSPVGGGAGGNRSFSMSDLRLSCVCW